MTAQQMELAYGHGVFDVPLMGQTIGESLATMARQRPDAHALISVPQGISYTFREFDAAVDELALALLARGLGPGDRVGIWSPNCAEWVLLQYATARVGVILVSINPAYRTHELDYVLRQSGCRVLFSAVSHRTSAYRAMCDEVAPQLDDLEHVVFLGTSDWDTLLDAGRAVPLANLRDLSSTLRFDDPVNIQYTSGTTGFPKGATLSHHNILNNGFFVGEICRYDSTDRVCLPVPFYHCFGMVLGNLACTTHGAAIVIPSPTFDARAVLETVESERCTSLYGVPTMFIAELADPDFDSFDLTSLRTGIMAGSPCPVDVMQRVMDAMHMPELTICYGMTETSPVSTQTRTDDDLDRRTKTVGRIHPHVEVKIIAADGRTVRRGEPGELLTRGYSVMLGYWDDPERTSQVIDAARWMHTGDLATMDDDGYVSIVGRLSDLVIRGGENIYPREIEEFLHTHPQIVDVQVVGVPDTRYGEELVAWIRLSEGAATSDYDIRQFCIGRIARFKVPRHVFFVDDFPMTLSGKVQKYKLREFAVRRLVIEAGTAATAR